MINAILIDDVERARAALRADLEDHCPEIRVIGEAEGVETGIAAIKKLKPDVVFLDIQMEDGTGFDLLEGLGRPDQSQFKVIFTTALNEHAIRAFKFSAVDYLLKPIDPDDLVKAVEKIVAEKKAQEKQSSPYDLLLENIRQIKHSSVKKIALNTQEKVHIVAINEIVHCESHSNYTLFHLIGNQKILVTKTMKEFEELLSEYDFLRVHHSHLINMEFLKEYVKIDGGYAIMNDNSQVPVSYP